MMETSLDRAPCYYFSSNDEGTILEVNQMLCRQLEFDKEQLLGNTADAIFTLATRIFHQTHFFPLLKMQGHADEIFITLQTKDKKQVPVLVNAERREANGNAVILYIGIPVYNRKKFEDELVAARKEAEAALRENTALQQAKQELQQHAEQLDQHIAKVNQQNEELKQFNRVITHDLQEPVRKLSVFSNMLLNAGENDGNSKTIVEKLLRASGQLRSVIAKLQEYIWLTESATNFTEIKFNKLLMVVQQKLETEFPGSSLIVKAEDIPVVQADWDQMQLVLHQLLSNAIRFRKKGEKAIVEITSTILQKNRFTNLEGKYHYQDFLKLQVKDWGIGFDPRGKDQVFDLFRNVHPASGYGIGLSLCKKVVENHWGKITIDSKPGEGTTVTILLPVANSRFNAGVERNTP
jgi:phosphoserine phosphatase RsbU/P